MHRLYGIPILEPKLIRLKKFRDEQLDYVTNRYHNTSSVTDMLQNLNWPSLEIRRTRVRRIMFYKIIHHVVAIHPLDTLLLPTTTITRYNSSHTYQHIRTDKDSYKYSFYTITIPLIRLPMPNGYHLHPSCFETCSYILTWKCRFVESI